MTKRIDYMRLDGGPCDGTRSPVAYVLLPGSTEADIASQPLPEWVTIPTNAGLMAYRYTGDVEVRGCEECDEKETRTAVYNFSHEVEPEPMPTGRFSVN